MLKHKNCNYGNRRLIAIAPRIYDLPLNKYRIAFQLQLQRYNNNRCKEVTRREARSCSLLPFVPHQRAMSTRNGRFWSLKLLNSRTATAAAWGEVKSTWQ